MPHRVALMVLLMLPSVLVLGSCGKEQDGSGVRSKRSAPAALVFMLAEEPQDAAPVGRIKAEGQVGEEVVVRGRIGGRVDPIARDLAIFLIADTSLLTCADLPDDHCPTPWDYCCEPRPSLMARTATVQIVTADGAPLEVNLREAGLSPMSEVVVRGRVGERPTPEILVINASGIWVKPEVSSHP